MMLYVEVNSRERVMLESLARDACRPGDLQAAATLIVSSAHDGSASFSACATMFAGDSQLLRGCQCDPRFTLLRALDLGDRRRE